MTVIDQLGPDGETPDGGVWQENTLLEEAHDERKYRKGALIQFVCTSPDEPDVPDLSNEPGDTLRVADRNACGMGIDALNLRTGKVDMVWPEEVVYIESQV
jgi:hypothetical protein